MHSAPAPLCAGARASVEERVDLLHARVDRDELGAALDHEPGVEAIALVHLEGEARRGRAAAPRARRASASALAQLPDGGAMYAGDARCARVVGEIAIAPA